MAEEERQVRLLWDGEPEVQVPAVRPETKALGRWGHSNVHVGLKGIEEKRSVYFLLSHDRMLVKVGKSHEPRTRIVNLRNANAHPLTVLLVIPGYTNVETWLHGQMRKHHSHGEWYWMRGRVLEVIEALCGGTPISELCPGAFKADTREYLSNTKR